MLKAFKFIFVFVSVVASQSIPFKSCPKTSPNLAECIKQAIEATRPFLPTGNFGEGFQVDAFEPFYIGNITINKGVKMDMIGLQSTGITNFVIDKIRINPENFKLEILANVPRVDLFGKYKMSFKLGLIDIKGQGDTNTVIDNVQLKLKVIGEKYIVDGAEYLKIVSGGISYRPGKVKIYFDNLFNGDKALSDLGNRLVNDNIDLFINDIKPAIEQSISKKVVVIMNQIFDKKPFNSFFTS